ncbi:MAG: hypothetical protein JW719_03255, partial [Pirellulales bacterium]|nr:hypothetical protein [Pirellulales bacterium]
SLRLTWGVDPRVVDLADQIYVFERLGHHLFPAGFSVLWFAALLFLWLAVRWQTPETHAAWRLHAFVVGTIFISLAGFAIAYATAGRPALAAELLRFYWFRLTDVMVPLGVAVGGAVIIDHARARKAWISPAVKTMLVVLAVWQVGQNGYEQIGGRPMRNLHEPEESHFDDWRDACRWIATAGQIPADARFLTPRACRTFKWYTGRAEVVNWKDIPQDPRSIVEWWRRHQMLHATGGETPKDRWFTSLADRGEDRLIELGRYYHADYVLTENWPPLALPVVFANDSFVVYRLSDSGSVGPDDE